MEQDIYYRKLFEEGPVGIIIGDMDGQVIKTNPALHAIVGHGPDRLKSLDDIVAITHPDDRASDLARFAEIMQGKRSSYQIEKRYIKPHGATVWGLLTVSVINDDSGKPMFVYAILEDITKHKRDAQKLRRSYEKVEMMNHKLIGNEVEIVRLKKELAEAKKQ